MKIICIGRNYSEHIKELQNTVPDEPVVFFKPDTALVRLYAPFYYPAFSKEVNYEVEILLRIGREGKNIEEKFAHKYYDEIGIGIDFTARDIQKKAMEKGLPWALSKGFNGSAPVSEFVARSKFPDLNNLKFSLTLNGEVKQNGNTSQMIHNFDKIVSYISAFVTLKNGDIIFTGTPAGVGNVQIGDKLAAFIEGERMLECEIK